MTRQAFTEAQPASLASVANMLSLPLSVSQTSAQMVAACTSYPGPQGLWCEWLYWGLGQNAGEVMAQNQLHKVFLVLRNDCLQSSSAIDAFIRDYYFDILYS